MTTLSVRILPITSEQTYALRHDVLWPDKPLSYVQLDEDLDGWHFGAFLDGETDVPISVISFYTKAAPGKETSDVPTARFRKFATAAAHQRRGVGTALLQHTMELMGRPVSEGGKGFKRVWCDARCDARRFYERAGMRVLAVEDEGKSFFKGDIEYVRMGMDLV